MSYPSPLHVVALRRELGVDLPEVPPDSVAEVPPAPGPAISLEMARGMRLAALRMAEVVHALLREAAEAEAAAGGVLDNRGEVEAAALLAHLTAPAATAPSPAPSREAGARRARRR